MGQADALGEPGRLAGVSRAQESARSGLRPRARDGLIGVGRRGHAAPAPRQNLGAPRSVRRSPPRPARPPRPAPARVLRAPERRPAVACADVIWAARPRLAAAASPDRERTGTRAGRGARRPRPQARAGQRAPDHVTRAPAARLISRARGAAGPTPGIPGRDVQHFLLRDLLRRRARGRAPLGQVRGARRSPGWERGSRPPSGPRHRSRPQWDPLHSRRPRARPWSPPPARTPVPPPGRPAHARGLGHFGVEGARAAGTSRRCSPWPPPGPPVPPVRPPCGSRAGSLP